MICPFVVGLNNVLSLNKLILFFVINVYLLSFCIIVFGHDTYIYIYINNVLIVKKEIITWRIQLSTK